MTDPCDSGGVFVDNCMWAYYRNRDFGLSSIVDYIHKLVFKKDPVKSIST